jgi:cytochrome c
MKPGKTFRNLFFTLLLGCAFSALALAQGATEPAREWITPPPGDAQKGAVLYQQNCTACHAIDSNKIGPAHRGVVGRRVGSLYRATSIPTSWPRRSCVGPHKP